LKFIYKNNSIYLYYISLFSSLAFLTHPIGLFLVISVFLTFIFNHKNYILSNKKVIFFSLIIFSIPIILWGIYIFKDINIFISQMSLQFARKFSKQKNFHYYYKILNYFLFRPLPLFLFIFIPIINYFIIKDKDNKLKKIIVFLLFLYIIFKLDISANREMWYPIYVYFLVSINIFIFLSLSKNSKHKNKIFMFFGILLVLVFTKTIRNYIENKNYFNKNFNIEIRKKINDFSDNLSKNDRVLYLGIPNYLTPFVEKNININVPRFIFKDPLSIKNLKKKYDYCIFVFDKENQSWDYFTENLKKIIRKKMNNKLIYNLIIIDTKNLKVKGAN